jgi:hypothetical protein
MERYTIVVTMIMVRKNKTRGLIFWVLFGFEEIVVFVFASVDVAVANDVAVDLVWNTEFRLCVRVRLVAKVGCWSAILWKPLLLLLVMMLLLLLLLLLLW